MPLFFKRIFWALLPGIVIVLVMAGYLLLQGVSPFEGWKPVKQGVQEISIAVCPIVLRQSLRREAADRWQVYRFQTESPAPMVVAEADPAVSPPGHGAGSCRLTYRGAPTAPGEQVDWRIGHIFSGVTPLLGKAIRVGLFVRADRTIVLDSAAAYVHNGIQGFSVPIDKITTEWRRVALKGQMPETAKFMEIWFRLVVGKGTMRPGNGVIHFLFVLEEDKEG